VLAGRRQLDLARGATQQLDAELVLKAPDLLRQRRLQALRRACEVKLLGHRHEIPQRTEIESHRRDQRTALARAALSVPAPVLAP
jgi:hypothetical protein